MKWLFALDTFLHTNLHQPVHDRLMDHFGWNRRQLVATMSSVIALTVLLAATLTSLTVQIYPFTPLTAIVPVALLSAANLLLMVLLVNKTGSDPDSKFLTLQQPFLLMRPFWNLALIGMIIALMVFTAVGRIQMGGMFSFALFFFVAMHAYDHLYGPNTTQLKVPEPATSS